MHDLPDGIAERSTRTRTVTDLYGRTRYRSTLLYRGAGEPMPILSWTLYTLDIDGRPTVETSSDGRVSETQWGCCGPELRTSPEGVATHYLYDAAKRLLLTSTHNGIADVVTSHTYDSAGRRTSTLVAAGGLVQLSTNVYDAVGRLAWTRGPDGIRTDHEYAAAGRITRTIRAGLATESERALDGGSKAVRVNGDLRSWTVRGVNPDGTRWTTVYEGPLGAASPVWSRTTTDFLGRTILEERPGFGDDIILVNTLTYAPGTGRLAETSAYSVSAVNPVNPVTLSQTIFVYDSLGDRYRTVQDLNLDGIVDLDGPDRVTDTHSGYVQLAGDWHRESRQYIYPGDATPKLVSTQRQRLTGLGTAVDGGILVAESVSIDLLGNATVNRTVLDRASRRVVQTSDSPTSALDALTVAVNGLTLTNVTSTGVATIFAYDALGRRISSRTDERSFALSSYNSLGQLASTGEIYLAPGSSEPTTNRTAFAYDTFTGRRVAVTNALGQVTHTAYDPEGRVIATWGATYPVAYEYDAFGRMTAMATTRDPAHESVNLITLLPVGVHLSHTSHASYPSHLLDTTRWLYHEPTGLLTNKVYADGKGTAYRYTPDGKLATRTWARLSPVTGLPLQTLYEYAPCCGGGTLTGIAYSDGTPSVTFAFDRLGRQLSAITAGVSTNLFAYDALTLALTNETVIAFGETNVLSRAQDTLGRPAGLSVAGLGEVGPVPVRRHLRVRHPRPLPLRLIPCVLCVLCGKLLLPPRFAPPRVRLERPRDGRRPHLRAQPRPHRRRLEHLRRHLGQRLRLHQRRPRTPHGAH
jgi:YD repeat-containing protein